MRSIGNVQLNRGSLHASKFNELVLGGVRRK
jgi:hypothetical protein